MSATHSELAAQTREIFTVTRLNQAARAALERSLGAVWVEGELSNLARPQSGHIYFSLKDDTAQVRCAMFRSRNSALRFAPDNGMQVLAHGRISVYEARGEYQLIVETLEPAGEGLLQLRFEKLKRKLAAEGLFDAETKREWPVWPRAIGVVTSASGAAVRDIVTVLGRRCAAIPVIIYPSTVQGDEAPAEIARAIASANRHAACDVLIVGRGGGSLEDLWAFNEDVVARAIHGSEIPVVSAVGHETDITIADFVADARAATPSAAAELVSPDSAETLAYLASLERRLTTRTRLELTGAQRMLQLISRRLISPRRYIETYYQRLDELSQRLPVAVGNRLKLEGTRLDAGAARLAATTPGNRIKLEFLTLTHLRARLDSALAAGLSDRARRLEQLKLVLDAVAPSATLARGYAIVVNADGDIVRDATSLSVGAKISARLARGRITAAVEDLSDDPPDADAPDRH